MNPEDQAAATNAHLRRQLDFARIQLRRAHEELDWAQEQIRVFRRLIERLHGS